MNRLKIQTTHFLHQKVRIKWAPQAIFFAGISTLAFIYFNMPIGFIFGFFATAYISGRRNIAKLSPKFYSTIVLSLVGFGFFYITSLDVIKDSTVLTAIAALSYLMCLEGVLFKSLPGGTIRILINSHKPNIKLMRGKILKIPCESLKDSNNSFPPPDSEFANMQQDLLSMGSFSLTFALGLIGYIFTILVLGLFIKVKSRK